MNLKCYQKKSPPFINSTITLPTMISINDLRNVVFYLKKKTQGIPVVEIRDIFGKRLFEHCKLVAYQTLGIVNFTNNNVSLSPLGAELAKHLTAEANIYREIIKKIYPYYSVLEWILQNKTNLVTYLEIVKFWNQTHPESFSLKGEKADENCVISFFYLCQSAELGMATVGRKGQPTRLIIEQDELRNFLETSNTFNYEPVSPNGKKRFPAGFFPSNSSHRPPRLFVSCSDKSDFSQTIQEILEISDIPFEVQIRVTQEILPLPQTYQTMQKCTAAIIIADQKNQVLCGGSRRFNDRLLSEIAASYALYETRVLLLWRGSNLPQTPFGDLQIAKLPDELNWQTGLELSRQIKSFKDHQCI